MPPRIILLIALFFSASIAHAQDPFEIHVYEYEPMSWRQYSLEAHLTYLAQGTATPDGMLLPTTHQTHVTLEPTVGLSPNFALGFMFLNAWEPWNSPEFNRLESLAAFLCTRILEATVSPRVRLRILVSEHAL